MTEYIINSEQLERLIAAIEHDTGREINRVVIDGERIPEIVRCRDCTYYDGEPDLDSSTPKCWRDPDHRGAPTWTRPDGFCAWAQRW